MDATHIFILLLLAGMLLMGAEIFVPGGVLGVLGAVALMGAVFMGFVAFGPQRGVLASLLILIFLAVSIIVWMQWIPRTRLGQTLTLSTDTAGYKSAVISMKAYVGKEGEAVTPMGPSGIIRIDGKRLDAVAEGKWIDAGARVRVVSVTGNHVTVRAVQAPPETKEPTEAA